MSDELGLTPAERAFLQALADLEVRYLLVGLGAALLHGAPVVTQDIDVWFGENAPWDKVDEAARRAGGFYTAGVGMHRPLIGGPGLDRVDLVLTAHGLSSFDEEYARAETYDVDGVQVTVLPLERVLASKRATGRAKDRAVIPALEDAIAARRNRA
ncbi:MAG TPA: hypothetical protein VFM29_05680 [Vicinamibacteria bacterium]|nr:hypothetical protein [Vicinamibacteria bacterium]